MVALQEVLEYFNRSGESEWREAEGLADGQRVRGPGVGERWERPREMLGVQTARTE